MNDILLAVILAALVLAVALLAVNLRTLSRKLDAVAVLLAAGEPTPEEMAVISAAIAVALSGPVRIHHIRVLPDDQQAAWSRIGRLDLMRSHAGSGRQG